MFRWYRELTSREKKTFWACFGGFGLDGMDVQIYSFVVPTLISLWKLTPADAGLLATCTLLFSAVGGWLTGILADRYGRVLMLQITIAWFAGFTFLQGLSAGFAWLLVARSLQGLGFGGEWAAGSVLAAEVIRSEHRGKAVGAVQSSWSIGWGIAALLCSVFRSGFSPAVYSAEWALSFRSFSRLKYGEAHRGFATISGEDSQPGSPSWSDYCRLGCL
jgi:MFS family permease